MDVEVLDDRYRLGEPIGRGGMADVYAAEDTASGRMVAVKVLRIGETADPARFEAEMQILRRLRHEAIVRLCDSGTTDADNPYFVMELIDGQTLSALVRDRGPLDPDRVAAIGARVAAALAHAHSRGVVHRDIKPGNILVDGRGLAYLTDFGVARLVDATQVTRQGTTIGTAAYLAPEQLVDSAVGPGADVYSLALVLLEALTGQRAFTGTGVEAAMARLGRDPEIPADLPGWWTGLLVAMTRRDPERRLSAEVVQQVLEGRHPPPPLDPEEWAARTRPATWAQDTPDGAQPGSGPFPAPVTPPPPTPPPATPPPPAPPAADARWPGGPGVADPAPRRSRGRLLAAVGSAALVVVLLVVGLWWGVFRSSPDEIVTGSRPVDMAARDVYDILVAADTLNATTDLELERRLFTLYDEAAHAIVASRWEDALAALVEMVEVSQQAVDSNAVDPVFLRRLGPALEQLRAEISAARQVEVGGD